MPDESRVRQQMWFHFGRRTGLWHVVAWLTICLAVAVPGSAGQGQDATIVGQVTDESGAVLPGVTVTAKSPALQVPEMSSVTNERGEYRLAPLPIGTYSVTYTLEGFQSVNRDEVRLTVGFVAKLDVVLKVGSLQESVTVSGASPVVDVTSTGTSTQLTKETLELIPSTRNGVVSLLAQAPGTRGSIDVGGSNFSTAPTFHSYGLDGESWQTLEGVFTASPQSNQGGNYYDYSSFEETRVVGVSKDASNPVRGIQVNTIVKSGGNQFHGEAFYSRAGRSLQANNVDADLARRGITGGNKLEDQWDGSADMGGRVVPNKLWFYVSARRRLRAEDVLNTFKSDGSPGVSTQRQTFGTGKASYQMNQGIRFVGFYQAARKWIDGQGISAYVPWASRYSGNVTPNTSKIEWQGIKGNLVTSFQFGRWEWRDSYEAHANGQVSTQDLSTLMVTGDSTNDQVRRHQWRNHANGLATWYRSSGFGGNHELKTGFDYMTATISSAQVNRPAGNYQLLFQNSVPFEIVTNNAPTAPLNSNAYLGIYLADNWTIARRLTINVGARYAHDRGFVPAQCRDTGGFSATLYPAFCIDQIDFKTWNTLAPRLQGSFDVRGDGKTVLKGGWNRYDHMRGVDEVTPANPISAYSSTFKWHDNNGDQLYEPGEVLLDPNGNDFVSSTAFGSGQATGAVGAVPDPNEKEPKFNETYLSIEHEVMSGFALRASGVYATYFNISRRVNVLRPYDIYTIPIMNVDPGPDGVVGTGDDTGKAYTYYDYPAAYAGSAFQRNELTVPPGQPTQNFKTLEFAASKRLSNHWHLMASYSTTKKHIPVPLGASYDPNTEINAADNTREWVGRVSGAYIFPSDVTVSGNFENRDGTPLARQVQFRGGKQIPSFVMNVEPIGSIRLPNTNVLDLRVEKAFRLTRGQKVTVRLNVYNSLNANTVTTMTVRSGASYLLPTAILPARIFEIGGSYTF